MAVAGTVAAHMAAVGTVVRTAAAGTVVHMAVAGDLQEDMPGGGMAAEEAELCTQKERDMVHGQELDKLGAAVVLRHMLKVLGMKLRRHRMATVLPQKERIGQQFDLPSCSSGIHNKKNNEAMEHQQKQ